MEERGYGLDEAGLDRRGWSLSTRPWAENLHLKCMFFCNANHHSRDLSAGEARDPGSGYAVSIRVLVSPHLAAETESGGSRDSVEISYRRLGLCSIWSEENPSVKWKNWQTGETNRWLMMLTHRRGKKEEKKKKSKLWKKWKRKKDDLYEYRVQVTSG